MKEYFQLQYRLINRKLTEIGAGLHPVICYGVLLLGFVGLSIYLFYATEFAGYLYILIALAVNAKLSEPKRNDFLKTCFSVKDYVKIRLIENVVSILPFAVFLGYKVLFLPICILVSISVLMAFIRLQTSFSITIPTPFSRKPFEFTVGFRNTFYLIIGAYFLTYLSISVNNFNLGVFSLLLVFLICLSFYAKPENEFFVWTYNKSPQRFLWEKMKTSLLFSTMLSLPILLVLGIFFFNNLNVLLFAQLLGYIFILTIILAKYSAYPDQMSLTQGIFIALSMYLPLILIAVIPFFYNQSIKRLNDYLK